MAGEFDDLGGIRLSTENSKRFKEPRNQFDDLGAKSLDPDGFSDLGARPIEQPRPTTKPKITSRVVGNIDLNKLPVVRNVDGSISTVRSISFNENGREILIPSLEQGTGRSLSEEEAISQFRRTGRFLGKFDTPEQATTFAKNLSANQGKIIGRDDFSDLGAKPLETPGLRQRVGRGFVKAITPIPALEKGVETIAAEIEDPTTLPGTLAAVEQRIVPESLRPPDQPPTIAQEAIRAAARSLIPIPPARLTAGLVKLAAPVSPLELAFDVAFPALAVGARVIRKPAAKIPGKLFSATGELTQEGSLISRDISREAFEEAKKLDDARRVVSKKPDKVFPKVDTETGPLTNPGPILARTVDDTTKIVEDFKKAVPEIAVDPDKVIAFREGRQITDIIIDSIEDGSVTIADGARLLGVEFKAGETVALLTKRLREAATRLGQGLNRLSQASKSFRDYLVKNPELAQSLDDALADVSLNQSLARRLLQPIANVANEVIQTWRGTIISGLGTAARNVISQSGRAGVGVIDDAINGTMRFLSGAEPFDNAFANVTEDVISFFRKMSPTQRRELDKLIDLFPTQKAVLSSNRLGDLTLSNRFTKVLNVFNTTQEDFFRRAAFDARLRSNMTRLGRSIDDLPKMLGTAQGRKTANKLVNDAVEHAMELTFAAQPKGAFGRAFLNIHDKAPILYTLGQAFPRFWLNAIKFTTEFSPLGVMFTKTATKNPELALRGLSRAMTGSIMFSGAVAVRSSKFAGEKWYEIKPNPDTEPNKVIDARNLQPFVAGLFVADFLNRLMEVRSGERTEVGYAPADIANALLAMRRTDFSGLPFLDNFVFNKKDVTESGRTMMKTLTKILGEFIGGFGTPFRTYRQVVNGGTEVIRATRESLLVGPFLAQIPGVREDVLPPLPSITRPGFKVREQVRKRQVPGIAIKTKTDVEKELDIVGIKEFQFAPNTGDEEANRLARLKMGVLVDLLVGEIIKVPQFKELLVEDRKDILLDELKGIRKRAVEEVREERPDIDELLKIRRAPTRERRLIEPLIESLRVDSAPEISLRSVSASVAKRLRERFTGNTRPPETNESLAEQRLREQARKEVQQEQTLLGNFPGDPAFERAVDLRSQELLRRRRRVTGDNSRPQGTAPGGGQGDLRNILFP